MSPKLFFKKYNFKLHYVQSLGQEDPLKKGMATHSSILAWRIPWTGEPDRLQSMGSQWDCKESHMTFTFSCVEFITFLLSSTVAGLHLESIFDLDM